MNEYYTFVGTHLGYPACCIEEFSYTVEHDVAHKREKRKLSGTGYVPCATCDHTFTTKQLIDNINETRQKHLPLFSEDMQHYILIDESKKVIGSTYSHKEYLAFYDDEPYEKNNKLLFVSLTFLKKIGKFYLKLWKKLSKK